MQPKPNKEIQLLPEHIINQIKAGEVIERPSTLIKEIIENSIDADSTKIELHIVNNGMDLIHIKDNGHGIESSGLELAFHRHATSKIGRFEDIYSLHSYGFRGEALASISSISKITCETKTREEHSSIKIEGGMTTEEQSEKSETNQTGTQIFIRDLFFNTPVRMKFLKSKTSEKNQLKKIINAFLLTHPEIEFSIRWDEQDKDFYPRVGEDDLTKRINLVLFPKRKQEFYFASKFYDGVDFKVYLSKESNRGNAHKSHYFFINGRYVQDIQIHKIILHSSSHLWSEGETGHYVAFIDIPSDELDVNVHPNKTIVKIFQAPKVYSVISGTIKAMYSKKQAHDYQSLPPREEQTAFVDSTTQLKDIDYKQVDFSQSNSLDTYFENLHSQNRPTDQFIQGSKSINMIMSTDTHLLIRIEERLMVVNILNLLKYELLKNLQEKNIFDEAVPLLVSRPIKCESPPSPALIEDLNNKGFEIDLLDKKTAIIRTFPKNLQGFAYIVVIEAVLKSKFESIIEFTKTDFNKLDMSSMSPGKILNVIESYSAAALIKAKVVKEISSNDLKRIYESK